MSYLYNSVYQLMHTPLSSFSHVFQGLDILTPTLIVPDGVKMVSIHVMFAFEVVYLPA